MAILTITNTRPARRNVAIALFLDKTRQARSKSSPVATDRQPDLWTNTTRATYHPYPGERYNWRLNVGLVSLKIVTILYHLSSAIKFYLLMIVLARVLALGVLLIKTHCHLTKLHVTEVDLSTYKQ